MILPDPSLPPDLAEQFPDTKENLELLVEESAEVIQAKTKLIRFGLKHLHHKTHLPAIDYLESEIGDFIAIVEILIANGTISRERILAARDSKFKRLPEWYNRKLPETGEDTDA